jgi:type IV pilus assembly protein PilA
LDATIKTIKGGSVMKKERGFTLIELLIVIAIIGVLAAIAIPQFASYRSRAFDAAAQADLRNAMTAQEAYFTDNETYSSTRAALEASEYNLFISPGVEIPDTFIITGESYHMEAHHPSGNGITYEIDGPGGSIEPKP